MINRTRPARKTRQQKTVAHCANSFNLKSRKCVGQFLLFQVKDVSVMASINPHIMKIITQRIKTPFCRKNAWAE